MKLICFLLLLVVCPAYDSTEVAESGELSGKEITASEKSAAVRERVKISVEERKAANAVEKIKTALQKADKKQSKLKRPGFDFAREMKIKAGLTNDTSALVLSQLETLRQAYTQAVVFDWSKAIEIDADLTEKLNREIKIGKAYSIEDVGDKIVLVLGVLDIILEGYSNTISTEDIIEEVVMLLDTSANITNSEAFEKAELDNDLGITAPADVVTVKYPDGIEVNAGNELTPTQVKDIPTVEWTADSSAHYTLVMLDPDAPARADPSLRSVLHWLVGNVPGANLDQGKTLFQYFGSGPPEGTGLHRYVFLVLKQPTSQLTISDNEVILNNSTNNRLNFDTAKFLADEGCTLMAGNFFESQYDDYVPIVHLQIGLITATQAAFTLAELDDDLGITAPADAVTVKYPDGIEVNAGNELTPTQVKDIPTVEWTADSSAHYTLVMLDPDAPARADPSLRSVLHWLVGNVPGANLDQGKTLFQYFGSGPPEGTGLHRYVFLVLKQPTSQLTISDNEVILNNSTNNRLNFDTAKFLADEGCTLVAGNLFEAQYDDYVPILHKQIGLI